LAFFQTDLNRKVGQTHQLVDDLDWRRILSLLFGGRIVTSPDERGNLALLHGVGVDQIEDRHVRTRGRVPFPISCVELRVLRLEGVPYFLPIARRHI
jgi:hypothetical protein